MRRETFEKIIDKLNEMDCESKSIVEFIKGDITFKSRTVNEINSYIMRACAVQSDMDKFVKDDLYHIIGMGNLSSSQMSQLVKATKQLTSHRTSIKSLAGKPLINVGAVNVNGKKSTYESTLLGMKFKGD